MIEAGFGMWQPTFRTVSQKPKLWLSDLAIVKVRPLPLRDAWNLLTLTIDANLFKEAFIKAQQENEALFKEQ